MNQNKLIKWDDFIYQSHIFGQVIEQAKRCALMKVPLLIQGETGTGKEMLARACHYSLYQDNHGGCQAPFLVVNCVAMPDEVVESELFGYAGDQLKHPQQGIIEQANGGTIFFDEIGEMSPHLQMKLLRFLYDGSFRRVGAEKEIAVDVRIISATRKNISSLVKSGQFREDLYYRLNVLNIRIPSLKQYPEDIEYLTNYFIKQHSQLLHVPDVSIQSDLLERLISHSWPGNVRELSNVLLQLLTEKVAQNPLNIILKANDLHFSNLQQPLITTDLLKGSLDEMMKVCEKQILELLYPDYPSSRKLAQRLQVSHTSIANKLREYQIVKK